MECHERPSHLSVQLELRSGLRFGLWQRDHASGSRANELAGGWTRHLNLEAEAFKPGWFRQVNSPHRSPLVRGR